MAKNDTILLDGIIDDRTEQSIPSKRRDEVFEYFACEQVLKDFDLSREEIENGLVDGRDDGGIDGFFIFVNGTMLLDPDSFVWPRSGAELEVWIITCKHHETFRQAPLDNLTASLLELFNFGTSAHEFKGSYSDQIKQSREYLKLAYRKLSPRLSKYSVNIIYASRGDTSDIGDSIISRSEQIKSIIKDAFSTCTVLFSFYGCAELIQLHRKNPLFTLELPFIEILSKGERYVLLASLKEFFRFVTDDGKLRRYLFDSNVRDFMGLNRVNEDIKETLKNDGSPDFWWLNNGVTILTTKASVTGKSIQLQDIQIVNGLQTTQSIYRYFENGGSDPNNRAVLIKIIVSNNEEVRDEIIRATNNQTTVEISSLHATDKIQRDIEEVMSRSGLFYERRKNYYINQGHQYSEVITPLYLAAGYVNLVLKLPKRATSLKSKFMRNEDAYSIVFSNFIPLDVWPKIARILKTTDEHLGKLRPVGNIANERFLRNWRHIVSYLTISKQLKNYNFTIDELIRYDLNRLTLNEIQMTWKFIESYGEKIMMNRGWRKLSTILGLCGDWGKQFNIAGFNRIEKGTFLISDYSGKSIHVTTEFVQKVNKLLPDQPWKPRVHLSIIEELKCSNAEYVEAVRLLIDQGVRYRQEKGIVYDAEGNIISFDKTRVNEEAVRKLISKDDTPN